MREITRTQISFADLEVGRRVRLDPLLQQISAFLDRHGELVTAVHRDLSRSLTHARRGRRGLNAEQVLRAFVLMRTKNWGYRELAERVADGLTLRQFTRFDSAPVPRHHAFQRAFVRLQATTLRRINEAIVAAAVQMGLEDVDKLRLDTTVVETDVRYPRDSGLLWDTVRVLSRLVEHIGELAPAACATFPRRTRRAKRRMQEIGRMRERARTLARKYRDLITVTTEVTEKAEAVTRKARTVRCTELLDTLKLQALCDEVTQVAALGRRVIDQSERRVFRGETVPADEKLYSLFEPHTDMIKRGKVYKPVEFGHKVLLVESRIGLITDYQVLDGNPIDSDQLVPSVQRHQKRFGKVPSVPAGDRGFYDAAGCEKVHRRGVTLVAIPQRGSKRSVEQEQFQKSRALEQAQAFRSGVEGRAKRFDPTRHRIVKASAESLNALRTLEKGSFDGAILVNVLYSLDDPFACLTGINRLLKPNGVIGLSTTHAAVKLDPLLDSIRRYLVEQHLFNDLRADYEQLHDINKRIERDIALRYSADQYVEMVAHAGFEILRHEDFTYEGAVMLIHARKNA